MRVLQNFGAIGLWGALVGCVGVNGAPQATNPLHAQSAACVRAVEMETNNHDVVVLGSNPLGVNTDVSLLVGGTGVWSCIVSAQGAVQGIQFLGSDGAPLA